jgi:hypothetical protein
LEQLKQKYAGVISTIEGFADLGAAVEQVDLDGEKIHLKATVPSAVVAWLDKCSTVAHICF